MSERYNPQSEYSALDKLDNVDKKLDKILLLLHEIKNNQKIKPAKLEKIITIEQK